MQLAAVEARTKRGGGGNAGTRTDRVKPPKFDRSTPWAPFNHQFESVTLATNCIMQKDSVFARRFAETCCRRPTQSEAAHEDTVKALKGRHGDHQQTAVDREQNQNLATRKVTSRVCNSRRAVGPPGPRRVCCGLHTEAGRPCIRRRRGQEPKQHLLKGGDKLLNEYLSQAQKLEAARAAAGPPTRLR
jgi:hypothetical protein